MLAWFGFIAIGVGFWMFTTQVTTVQKDKAASTVWTVLAAFAVLGLLLECISRGGRPPVGW